MTSPDIFAWVGTDATGSSGIMAITTPFGIGPAAFNKRRIAEDFRDQAQNRANMLGVEVQLMRFSQAETLDTVTPRTN